MLTVASLLGLLACRPDPEPVAPSCVPSPVDWLVVRTGASVDLEGVALTGGRGRAVGEAGALWTTADGGETWAEEQSPTGGDLHAVWRDADDGWIAGDEGLWHDADPDGTPDLTAVDAGLADYDAVTFAGDVGVTGGTAGVAWTEDGGATWDVWDADGAVVRAAWVSPDGRTRLVAGDGGFLATWTASGWETIDTAIADDLHAIAMNRYGAGVVVGDFGAVLITADGGASWTVAYRPMTPSGDILAAAALGHELYSGSSQGAVHQSHDGQRWYPVHIDTDARPGLRSLWASEDPSTGEAELIAVGGRKALIDGLVCDGG